MLGSLLDREAGFLQRHPYLLPSHFHNMLHSEAGGQSLAAQARQVLAARPWAQLCNRIDRMPGHGALRVLEHASEVRALAYSPDGTLVATVGDDSIVRIWNPESGRCTDELPCEVTLRDRLEWSPDGRWLASAGERGVWICEMTSRRSRTYSDRGSVIAWEPHSTRIASARAAVDIWDPENGEVTRQLEGGPVLASALAWSPSGSWLASGDSTGTIRIWSLAGDGRAEVIQLGVMSSIRPRSHEITGLAWAPREPVLAAAVRDGTVSFFQPDPWDERARVKFSESGLGALSWSPDGTMLAVARGNLLDLVDARSSLRRGFLGEQSDWARVSARGPFGTRAAAAPVIGSCEGHTGVIVAAAWSPDGTTVASAGRDSTVRFWSVERILRGTGSPAPGRGHSQGRARDLSAVVEQRGADSHNTVDDREVERRSVTQLVEEDPEQAAELLIAEFLGSSGTSGVRSPDGNRLAIGKEDGEIRITTVEPGGADRLIREGWTEAKAQDYANYRRQSGLIDFEMNIGGYRLRLNDPDFSPVDALAWSPDGRRLAAAGLKFGLEIHDLETGELRKFDTGSDYLTMRHLAWSPDGTLLASAEGARGLVRLWNPVDGGARTVFEGDRTWRALAWAPNGSLLGFASEDGCVRVWSKVTERTLLVARTYSPAQLLRFGEDVRYLAAVDDGAGTGSRLQAYIWKLRSFGTEPLRVELDRIEAAFGPRAVRGGAISAKREVPSGGGGVTVVAPKAARSPASQARETEANERRRHAAEADERRRHAAGLLTQASSLLEESPSQALAMFDEQESIWRALGDRAGLASCLAGRAAALMAAGRHEDALLSLQETVTISRELGQATRLMAALGDQGNVLRKLGRHDQALAAYAEEEALCRQMNDRTGLARNLADQARSLAAREDWVAALTRLREEETLLDPVTDRAALAHNLGFQGWILVGRHDGREVVAVLERQEAVLRELADPALLAEGLLRQVEQLLAVGEVGLARHRAAESAGIFATLDRPVDEAKARTLMMKARIGRPTPIKGVALLLAMLAPAAIGIALGLRSRWWWLAGGPLVLLSAFMLTAGFSPRLRQVVERLVSKP